MNSIIKILAIIILIAVGTGFYFRMNDNMILGDRIIGIAVLASAFILMPLFLYIRWKDKNLKDYTFTKENLDKMRDKDL
jgi:multisubunit Na+/H+ antiporter MnhC subunit